MIPTFWKQEFHLERLWFEHSMPSQFTRCQWQRRDEVSIPYLVYRWLLACYLLGSMIACILEPTAVPGFTAKWPIYLTNWSYVVSTVQALLATFIVTDKARRERAKNNAREPKKPKMPPLYKLYWALHTMAVVLAFGITTAYWLVVYNPQEHKVTAFNLMAHVFNSVVIGLDFLLVSHPFHLFHGVWTVLYIAIYLIFSAVYFALGGTDRHSNTYIYPLLKWERGWQTVLIALFGMLITFGVHCLAWSIFVLRRILASRWGCGWAEDNNAKKTFEKSFACYYSSMQLEGCQETLTDDMKRNLVPAGRFEQI